MAIANYCLLIIYIVIVIVIAKALILAISFSRIKYLVIYYNTISIILLLRKNATNRLVLRLFKLLYLKQERRKVILISRCPMKVIVKWN